MSLYINIYFTCVFIYSTLHVNYSLYIINRNILFNAIVTCMNKLYNDIKYSCPGNHMAINSSFIMQQSQFQCKISILNKFKLNMIHNEEYNRCNTIYMSCY